MKNIEIKEVKTRIGVQVEFIHNGKEYHMGFTQDRRNNWHSVLNVETKAMSSRTGFKKVYTDSTIEKFEDYFMNKCNQTRMLFVTK